jgi:hypothetical protein
VLRINLPAQVQQGYLESLVNFPQCSGRSGNAKQSQAPPSAWTKSTALVKRPSRMLTAAWPAALVIYTPFWWG